MRITSTHLYFFTAKEEFSNWYMSDFEVKGIKFNCMEQYMMYAKAKLFNDDKIAADVLKEPQPASQKALGRKVKGFDQTIWDSKKENIIVAGLIHKFDQNEHLRDCLIYSKRYRLVEASYDKIWGCGFREKDAKINNEANWTGENLLGNCLEKARAVLIKKYGMENNKDLDNIELHSAYDKTWGCGYDMDNPKILDDAKWPGLNLLGKCLETARLVLVQKLGNINEQNLNSSKDREYTSEGLANMFKKDNIPKNKPRP